MSIQQKEFIRFIKLLADNDCLEYVILIGSWAEFLYRELGILQKFEPNIKTLDIDFLLKNLRRPIPEKNIIPLAKAAGYLIESNRLYGTTKIYDKNGLEIEFLINQLGAGSESTLKTNLGVTAQALRHLHILSANALSVVYLGFTISIPKPEAYAIHKMVINLERGKKQEKDRLAVRNIWPYLDKESAYAIYTTLTKKEKKTVDAFMTENNMTFSSF